MKIALKTIIYIVLHLLKSKEFCDLKSLEIVQWFQRICMSSWVFDQLLYMVIPKLAWRNSLTFTRSAHKNSLECPQLVNLVHWLQLGIPDSGFVIRFRYSVFTVFPDLKATLNVREKAQNGTKILNTNILSTPSCWPRWQNKWKSIGHATACSTLIISCNSNITHSLTFPKTLGKGPKRLKVLKNYHIS